MLFHEMGPGTGVGSSRPQVGIPLVLVLIVAAARCWLLGEGTEAAAMLLIVTLNAVLGLPAHGRSGGTVRDGGMPMVDPDGKRAEEHPQEADDEQRNDLALEEAHPQIDGADRVRHLRDRQGSDEGEEWAANEAERVSRQIGRDRELQ
jgi:hypothetical protein